LDEKHFGFFNSLYVFSYFCFCFAILLVTGTTDYPIGSQQRRIEGCQAEYRQSSELSCEVLQLNGNSLSSVLPNQHSPAVIPVVDELNQRTTVQDAHELLLRISEQGIGCLNMKKRLIFFISSFLVKPKQTGNREGD